MLLRCIVPQALEAKEAKGSTRLARTASGGSAPARLRLQLRVKGTNMRWSEPIPLDDLLVSGARTVECSPVRLYVAG